MLIPLSDLIKKYKIKPIGVFHCGASLGQEVKDYYRNGIKSTVWIEALPRVYAQLLLNIINYPDAIAINACIGDSNGKEVMFNVANNEGQSSSFLDFGTHTKEHPTVKFTDKIPMVTKRLDTLIEEHKLQMHKYDFLNVDLQGAELLALKGLGKYLENFLYLYIEVNTAELYRGCPMVEEIDAYVETYGFKRVETKMTGWKWGDAFYKK